MKCKKCGQILPENARFCFECGTKVEQELICSVCGAKMPVGYKYCMECGSVLSDSGTSMREEEAGISKLQEEMAAPLKNSRYETWWSEIYGQNNYVVYKGYIYCIVPAAFLTGKFTDRYEKNWIIARVEIASGEKDILQEINLDDYKCEDFSFAIHSSEKIPFSIYDDKIYYYSIGLEDFRTVYIFDINTMKVVTKTVACRLDDSGVIGIFKSCNEEVCIKYDYDYKKEICVYHITTLDGKRKKKLTLAGQLNIIAYNECYVYYQYGYLQKEGLYAVNLETFKEINLGDKLTNLNKGRLYGVDPQKDVIYVLGEDKMISVNMNNEIVEELSIPELPGYIEPSRRTKKELEQVVSHRGYLGDDHGIYYNGENWIFKINPEDVDTGMLIGIILFDKKCKEKGSLLKYKIDRESVARTFMVFMFPTTIAFLTEMVGDYIWRGRILSVTEKDVVDTGTNWCWKY